MTQKEKELLLKDLSARLPYGVKINIKSDYTREMENTELTPYHIDGLGYNAEYRNLRPYLRPMSSMTEEEKEDYVSLSNHCVNTSVGFAYLEAQVLVEWLNFHHFDFRNLIERGLALEAKEGMYK